MHIPELPAGWHWRVVANTNCEYEDGTDFHALTEVHGSNHIGIPARTTIILIAERDGKEMPENENESVHEYERDEDVPEENSEWL